MSYPLPGIIVPATIPNTVVNIYSERGSLITAYADRFGLIPISFPQTISASTTYYLPSEGPGQVSAKSSGIELCGSVIILEEQQVGTIPYGLPPGTQIELI